MYLSRRAGTKGHFIQEKAHALFGPALKNRIKDWTDSWRKAPNVFWVKKHF